MDLVTKENQLVALLDQCGEWISEERIADWRETTLAGEPVVVFEMLCVQLFEVDASMPYKLWERLRQLGNELDIDASYCARLKPRVQADESAGRE